MPAMTQLPTGGPPTGTELLWAVQGGVDVSLTVDQILGIAAQGVYSATFGSGYLQFTGPGQSLQASINFIVGTNLPNPTGTPGAALLLGSGGGGGHNVTACIISDQAYDAASPGNTLLITAGETQPSGSAPGGLLWLIGGGSYGGTGGGITIQGGTSLNGAGGPLILWGGNATNAGGPPGDAYLGGGQVGSVGANVHLIATYLNGVYGLVRMRANSNIMADFIPFGAPSGGIQPFSLFIYNQTIAGPVTSGYGAAGTPLVSGGLAGQTQWFTAGFSGSMTFGSGHTATVVNGLITGYT